MGILSFFFLFSFSHERKPLSVGARMLLSLSININLHATPRPPEAQHGPWGHTVYLHTANSPEWSFRHAEPPQRHSSNGYANPYYPCPAPIDLEALWGKENKRKKKTNQPVSLTIVWASVPGTRSLSIPTPATGLIPPGQGQKGESRRASRVAPVLVRVSACRYGMYIVQYRTVSYRTRWIDLRLGVHQRWLSIQQ
jgi:hypothetical protein